MYKTMMYILKMMPTHMELIITYSPEKRSKRGSPVISVCFLKKKFYI